MGIKLLFECSGCNRKAEGTGLLRKRFTSVSGRDYGFGTARWDNTPEDVAPEGWVAADPYTYLCYCPECWAGIEASI